MAGSNSLSRGSHATDTQFVDHHNLPAPNTPQPTWATLAMGYGAGILRSAVIDIDRAVPQQISWKDSLGSALGQERGILRCDLGLLCLWVPFTEESYPRQDGSQTG